MEGKIKWYSFDKGYGFIEGEDGNDYFVHHTQVPENVRLDEGESVTFDTAETERGKQARNVRPAGEASAPGEQSEEEQHEEESPAENE